MRSRPAWLSISNGLQVMFTNNPTNKQFQWPRRQRGVALFLALVLLLVLTIIGVSSVQSTSLELRMSRNEHDTMLAFQSAESALRDAETAIEALANTAGFAPNGANGLYLSTNIDDAAWQEANVWTGGNSVVAPTNINGVAAGGRYIIEHTGQVLIMDNSHQIDGRNDGVLDRIDMFRITARGVGGTVNSRVMLQTTYGRVM